MATTRSLGLKYITRIDYEGQTPGWWVRVQRRVEGKPKPLMISQFFSDKEYRGKAKALVAAKLFRKGALEAAPPPQLERHQPPGVKNGYGYAKWSSVKRKKSVKDPKTGKRTVVVTEVRVREGWYRDRRGKVHRTKVSAARWGEKEAEARIDAWLAKKNGRAVRARAA